MKNLFQKIRTFVVAHKIVSAVAIIIIIFGGYKLLKGNTTAQTRYVLAAAEKGSVIVSVDGSGQVSTSNEIEIKPKASGDISYIAATSGMEVKKGQLILSLDSRDAQKSVRDAELALEMAQFDLKTAQSDLESTKSSQDLSLGNQLTTLNSSLIVVPDELNKQTDIATISGTYNSTVKGRYTIKPYSCSGGSCIEYSGIESGNIFVGIGIPVPLGDKGLYITFSEAPAIGNTWYVDVPSPLSSSYFSNLKSYTEKEQSSQDAITSAEQAVASRELTLRQRENALTDARDALSDYSVRAPFSGVLASVPLHVGDTATSSTSVATIITDQKIAEISMNEVDVAKIKLGQKATLTFDAVPDLTITGAVSEIDTIGTISQGVVTYDVKISFDANDERVKPGMSVSSAIITAVKTDVLSVPNSAIKTSGGQSYVEVLDNPDAEVAGTVGVTSSTAPRQVPVELGISNDTTTEIISGIKEGDEVISRTVTSAAKPATTSSAPSLFGTGGGTRAGGGAVRVGGAGR